MNIDSPSSNEMKERVDYPLSEQLHPATINHHRRMAELRPNQISFTAVDLISMLSSVKSSKYHYSKDKGREGQTEGIPQPPKGTYFLIQPKKPTGRTKNC